ncbi:uncharacterized protein AUP68_16060 [Ilyonectria robusta]
MDPSQGSVSRDLKDTRAASSTSLASAVSNSSSSNKPPVLAQRSPSVSISAGSGSTSATKSAHRQSFVEGLRNAPSSPRSQRHPSFTQAALQELLNHPPAGNKHANPRFAGRDWRDVSIGELVSPDDIKWMELDSSIEEATKLLLKSPTNVVLVREDPDSLIAVSTFDFTDLNAYLLVVVGLAKPDEDHLELFNFILSKAQKGENISLRDVQPLFHKESLVKLPATEDLTQAVQILGSGIHRLLVTAQDDKVVGIASQLRIVEFFWNEGVNFPSIERLYPVILRDLGIGTKEIISVKYVMKSKSLGAMC